MKRERFNYYGKWVFTDIIGLSCGIEKGDIVTITRTSIKKDGMIHGTKEDRTPVHFHHTNLTKEYFVRPKDY